MSNTYLNQALFLVMNGLICSGTASNSFCEIKVLDETFQMCVYVWRSQPFFIQNIQRKEEAMIIFTSLLTQRLFLCSMIFLERLRKNPAKPIEIKYISYFLQPSSLLFVYLMKALLQKLILFTQMFSQRLVYWFRFVQLSLSKVLYLVLTCSNLKVFSSSRMCTKLKQILELNSLYYYSVLTCSSTFS